MLPEDEVDENSPRAFYGTDSPCANGRPQVSAKAKRPRRTLAVVLEEMGDTWRYQASFYCVKDLLTPGSLFPSEDIWPIHAAAYFGDEEAMKFISSLRPEEFTRKTSLGRTPLEIAQHFNTRGSHDRFITMLMHMTNLPNRDAERQR
eukprot:Skav230473  [mRNA]  locus=scaffold4639:20442:22067:+ [translate_table: standard]